jgi:hypothetical protein
VSGSDLRCPFCAAPIPALDLPFRCPCCSCLEAHWNIMMNCGNCGFAPHFISCPFCNVEFDLFYLMGGYGDADGQSDPPEPRVSFDNKLSIRFGNLNPKLAESVDKTEFQRFAERALDILANCRFDFPFPIARAVMHTAIVASDKSHWVHLWVYQSEDAELPFGQVALTFPGRGASGTQDISTWSCVLGEVFFRPE